MNMVLALMVIFKIITIRNALVGFANSGLMTVLGARPRPRFLLSRTSLAQGSCQGACCT